MDKKYFIHSEDGKIGKKGISSAADVDAIVEAIADSKLKHLVLHFHGGLVTEKKGLEIAEGLFPHYRDAGTYPVFFIWESGFPETLFNNWKGLGRDPVFHRIFEKIVSFAGQKVLDVMHGIRPVQVVSFSEVEPLFDTATIQADLEKDAVLLRALRGRDQLPLHPVALKPNAKPKDFLSCLETEGMVVPFGISGFWWFIASTVVQVLVAVVSRFWNHRDHGLHATCMEELLRVLKLGGVPLNELAKGLTWNPMKGDAGDMFGNDPNTFAGTALLSRLATAMKSGLLIEKITVVGHSAGAILATHWLENARSALPAPTKSNVIFLAPAITYERFAEALSKSIRVDGFRMFAMADDRERADQLIGQDDEIQGGKNAWAILYPSSLLYLVSGVLESRMKQGQLVDEADVPLLGLERFFTNYGLYEGAGYGSIGTVRAWWKNYKNAIVWARSLNKPEGLNSDCVDHGSMDHEYHTLESVKAILAKGY